MVSLGKNVLMNKNIKLFVAQGVRRNAGRGKFGAKTSCDGHFLQILCVMCLLWHQTIEIVGGPFKTNYLLKVCGTKVSSHKVLRDKLFVAQSESVRNLKSHIHSPSHPTPKTKKKNHGFLLPQTLRFPQSFFVRLIWPISLLFQLRDAREKDLGKVILLYGFNSVFFFFFFFLKKRIMKFMFLSKTKNLKRSSVCNMLIILLIKPSQIWLTPTSRTRNICPL